MLLLGDCNQWLKEINDNSIDLLVTDPPYGLEFMGKDWDRVVVPTETWKECYRVLKQGKLAFVMCSPRQDVLARMIVNLQDAGFRTNYSSIYWSYASGFPKAKNNRDGSYSGFQPKPAVEVILVVSKGKTLTWLDDCRIPYQSKDDIETTQKGNERLNRGCPTGYRQYTVEKGYDRMVNPTEYKRAVDEKGRFPANILVSDDVLNDGSVHKSGRFEDHHVLDSNDRLTYGQFKGSNNRVSYGDEGSYSRYFSLDSWAEKTLPFLIVAKASRSERGSFNTHATVKPIKLMSYIITMGSREGDLVLDPFCGSGTVLIAADQLHRKWIGIERNPEYAEIIKKRLMVPLSQLKLSIYS